MLFIVIIIMLEHSDISFHSFHLPIRILLHKNIRVQFAPNISWIGYENSHYYVHMPLPVLKMIIGNVKLLPFLHFPIFSFHLPMKNWFCQDIRVEDSVCTKYIRIRVRKLPLLCTRYFLSLFPFSACIKIFFRLSSLKIAYVVLFVDFLVKYSTM